MGLFTRTKKQTVGWEKDLSAKRINQIIASERAVLQLNEQEERKEKAIGLFFKNLQEDELPAARRLAALIEKKELYTDRGREQLEDIEEELRGGAKTVENLSGHAKEMASLADQAHRQLEWDRKALKKALPHEAHDVKHLDKREEDIISSARDLDKALEQVQATLSSLATKADRIRGGARFSEKELHSMLIECRHLKREIRGMEKEVGSIHRIHKLIMKVSSKLYTSFKELTDASRELREEYAA